jgi:hypothetical protein
MHEHSIEANRHVMTGLYEANFCKPPYAAGGRHPTPNGSPVPAVVYHATIPYLLEQGFEDAS